MSSQINNLPPPTWVPPPPPPYPASFNLPNPTAAPGSAPVVVAATAISTGYVSSYKPSSVSPVSTPASAVLDVPVQPKPIAASAVPLPDSSGQQPPSAPISPSPVSVASATVTATAAPGSALNPLSSAAATAASLTATETHDATANSKLTNWKFYLLAGGVALLGIAGMVVSDILGTKHEIAFMDTSTLLLGSAITISTIAALVFLWKHGGWSQNIVAKTSFTIGVLILGFLSYYLLNDQNFGQGPFTESIERALSHHTWQEWTIAGAMTAGFGLILGSVIGAYKLYKNRSEEQAACQPKGPTL